MSSLLDLRGLVIDIVQRRLVDLTVICDRGTRPAREATTGLLGTGRRAL
ncbi:MAG: hypothetical protein ACRDYA_10370 [Egibacteraceae bacterium]